MDAQLSMDLIMLACVSIFEASYYIIIYYVNSIIHFSVQDFPFPGRTDDVEGSLFNGNTVDLGHVTVGIDWYSHRLLLFLYAS